MNTEIFLTALAAHTCVDQEEVQHRDKMMRFVASHRFNWWTRANVEGHVTGSAWILNSARTHALLLHHVKLAMWVQPGGHLDDTDASPAAGAMREAQEETGIAGLTFGSDTLFDLDIHQIPARDNPQRAEPAHLHYDARYLIIAADAELKISAESLDAKWLALDILTQSSRERSIARMAEKSLRLNS
ncbi:MAG: NUDIX hydrolase [Burkholderiales bacterium]|nr:NUDIX hydrolase [Burkholderiales bacterium]